jgi:hypothetical protein
MYFLQILREKRVKMMALAQIRGIVRSMIPDKSASMVEEMITLEMSHGTNHLAAGLRSQMQANHPHHRRSNDPHLQITSDIQDQVTANITEIDHRLSIKSTLGDAIDLRHGMTMAMIGHYPLTIMIL